VKRGRPLGRRAYRRRRTDRPVTGRPALSVPAWQQLRTMVLIERAGKACEFCGCRRGVIDPHHVVPRSHGGADTWENIIALCRRVCHEMTTAAYEQHRLVIVPDGWGRFLCRIVKGVSKDDFRTLDWRVVGRPPTPAEQTRLDLLYRRSR
jgi:hypothetical protein